MRNASRLESLEKAGDGKRVEPGAPPRSLVRGRQSLAIATSEGEADDQAFVDAISVPLDADDAPPA